MYNQIKNILTENNLICDLTVRVFWGVPGPNFSVGDGLPLDKKRFSDDSRARIQLMSETTHREYQIPQVDTAVL